MLIKEMTSGSYVMYIFDTMFLKRWMCAFQVIFSLVSPVS